jgi:subunit 11 of the general transcription factor TFIIH
MAGRGGFLSPLLSPAQSSIASSVAGVLPQPRGHPLKPGSTKESTFIRYLDESILKIQRRFAKRGSDGNDGNMKLEATGYKSFSEPAKDIEILIDLIWLSGTRMRFCSDLKYAAN